MIRACVITKITYRDDAIAVAECVICYKATPGYLASALHRDGGWGSFEKNAERCVFVSATGKTLNFDDLPTNPVLVRGDLQISDIIEIIRSDPYAFTQLLDPRIELGSSPGEVIINRSLALRRQSDGIWSRPGQANPRTRARIP